MNTATLKRTLRAYLESYLVSRGINPRKNFTCLNPAHEDRHPSMSFDAPRHRVHCFACGATYDLFDLIGIDFSLPDFSDQLSKACELFGHEAPFPVKKKPKKHPIIHTTAHTQQPTHTPPAVPAPSGSTAAYCKACTDRLSLTDYPARRGLCAETAAHFRLGYDPAYACGTGGAPWQALIIPTGEDSYTVRNMDSTADKRHRIRKQGSSPIFNAQTLRTAKGPVFVVEGEIDAMSLYEAGADAVALGSVANARRFLQLLEETTPAGPLILSLDNDTEGQRATETIEEALREKGLPFTRANVSGDCKDPNEALVADRETFVSTVKGLLSLELDMEAAEREAYEKTNVASLLPAFLNGVAESVNTRAVPTGFVGLDTELDGGLFEGLYIVGAISSLGKTALMVQMADQIAQSGQDVLIFSLEMARSELMARSISRMTLLLSMAGGRDTRDAKTARGITTGSRYERYSAMELALIEEGVREYGKWARRLYISEGIGEIGAAQVREGVQRHVRLTGRVPVVVIDYLQILTPENERATDKQNTDRAVLELKRISRDFKAPVVAISSFNRANYREAVTMEAFKESGAIEYSSDVLIGLQLKGAGGPGFDANEAKSRNPRNVELVILKNRNGPAGRKVSFLYYPLFNYFTEAES